MRKRICLLLFIAGFLFFALSPAEASINWGTNGSNPVSDQFNYQVQDSGLYTNWPAQLGPSLSSGQQVTNLGGFTGLESGTATASESLPGLSMSSGASGQQLSTGAGGASVNAYTTANLALSDTGQVGVDHAQQTATSFITRTFTVDTSGSYTLNGSASAPVSWGGTTTGTATTSSGYNGAVTLTEISTANGGATSLGTWSLSLNQLLDSNSAHSISNILLVPKDSLGNTVYYTLSVAINGSPGSGISSLFNSYNSAYWTFLGAINGTYSAGTAANPVIINGSLSAVPIPGSVILLISGLGSLVVLRRKRA
jgi:hypothetical protein